MSESKMGSGWSATIFKRDRPSRGLVIMARDAEVIEFARDLQDFIGQSTVRRRDHFVWSDRAYRFSGKRYGD
jgi:hypothetical protein